MTTTDNSRADALTDEQREAIKKSAFLLEIFAGHDSGANLRHHFGADWHKHAKAHAAMLRAILTASPIEHHEAAPAGLNFEPDAQHSIADMANIGYALMQRIAQMAPGYSWCECPTEIVSDLINERDEALAAAKPAPSAPLEGTGNGADERAAFEKEIGQLIDERDCFEHMGTVLAGKVSELFVIDVGEWSSANNPIFRAIHIVEDQIARAPRTEVAGAVACETCNGRGEVGGFQVTGFGEGGYDSQPCPDCSADAAAAGQKAVAIVTETHEAREKPDLYTIKAKARLNIGDRLYTAPPAQVATREGLTDRLIAEFGHELAKLLAIDSFDIADRDAQIRALLEGAKHE
ncbi:hypothetical protein WK25_05910 [Burkholderia latens]|uniref:hypothetical protein n=1 Tax=Burkholderia latens TaxID=488446 RepID=UPI0008415B2C|nr:hypothetical protein [Burkholderia latens]AOK04044.1 hypothetical protein WK25_05910 [Burkholderia latens]